MSSVVKDLIDRVKHLTKEGTDEALKELQDMLQELEAAIQEKKDN